MALRRWCLSAFNHSIETKLWFHFFSFSCCANIQNSVVRSSKSLARCVSSHSSPKICETSDKSCIVCYHPTNPFEYQNTRPIPRPDPSSPKEAVEGVLKVKFLSEKWAKEREGPSPEELGKMFFTTKHRWYPIGIRRRMARKPKPARERPYL